MVSSVVGVNPYIHIKRSKCAREDIYHVDVHYSTTYFYLPSRYCNHSVGLEICPVICAGAEDLVQRENL